jgi:hypothetical protein
MSANHPEQENLINAEKRIDEIVCSVNEAKLDAENSAKMIEIKNSLIQAHKNVCILVCL